MGARSRFFPRSVVAAAVLLQLLACSSYVAVAADPPFTCGDGAPPNIPFCDQRLPVDRRADDLVSRLTVEEKISQLGDQSPAITRLGVPAYKWWSEALHGVANAGRGIHLDGPLRATTSFPQVILTAASFNPHLWYRIGQVRTPYHVMHDLPLFPLRPRVVKCTVQRGCFFWRVIQEFVLISTQTQGSSSKCEVYTSRALGNLAHIIDELEQDISVRGCTEASRGLASNFTNRAYQKLNAFSYERGRYTQLYSSWFVWVKSICMVMQLVMH
jgi:hypothetical protein